MSNPQWPGAFDVEIDIDGLKKQFAKLAENIDSQAFLCGYDRGDDQASINASRAASLERLAEAESIIFEYLKK